MSTLNLLIAEHFEGIIWRIEIDSISHTLFAEVRNHDDRRVNFTAIDLNTGRTLFKDKAIDEQWLTGIETAYNGIILLHFYQTTNAPTHKGLMALEALTGNTLWSNFNYSYNHLTVNGPVLYDSRLQPPKLQLVDIVTGVAERPFEPAIDIDYTNNVHIPQQSATLSRLPLLPVEPYGDHMQYIKYNNLIIVSLHAVWAGQLRQYLFVINNQEIIFEDILNMNIQKLQPEAFVLYRNQLIYLKDKSEIKVLNL